MKSKGKALSAVLIVSPNSERATVVAEALFAVKARDVLMVGHAPGLKQPARVTVTAVETVRSLPGTATTGPAGVSVITGKVAGNTGPPHFVATTVDALSTEFASFKGPKGGPPGEHDVNREACPI